MRNPQKSVLVSERPLRRTRGIYLVRCPLISGDDHVVGEEGTWVDTSDTVFRVRLYRIMGISWISGRMRRLEVTSRLSSALIG